MTDAPPSMQAWAALHRAHARLSLQLTRRLEIELGVSLNEHGTLFELGRAPGRRLKLQDLGDRLGIQPQQRDAARRPTRGAGLDPTRGPPG